MKGFFWFLRLTHTYTLGQSLVEPPGAKGRTQASRTNKTKEDACLAESACVQKQQLASMTRTNVHGVVALTLPHMPFHINNLRKRLL